MQRRTVSSRLQTIHRYNWVGTLKSLLKASVDLSRGVNVQHCVILSLLKTKGCCKKMWKYVLQVYWLFCNFCNWFLKNFAECLYCDINFNITYYYTFIWVLKTQLWILAFCIVKFLQDSRYNSNVFHYCISLQSN